MLDWLSEYRKAIREYVRDYVFENTSLKVLALLITAVLWLSVASRPVSQITLNGVPIEFHNSDPSQNLTVSKYDASAARVYLEGPRDVLDAVRGGQFVATADMSGIQPGFRVLALKIDPKSLPANVRVKGIDPASVRVTVEQVIEREIPITPRFEGSPPPGYEVIDWHVDPETVKIAGAESQVRDINEVSTASVRLSNRMAPFYETAAIDIGSPNLTISGDGSRKVTLSVNIGESRMQRIISGVPVTLIGGPLRARCEPSVISVTVFGSKTDVNSLKSIDLTAMVEFHPGVHIATPNVKLPSDLSDRVTVRSVTPEKVRIR